MNEHRTIGILGGMGPMATVEFFRRLVAATPVSHDQDHLHILIDNDPGVPNRSDAIVHGGPDPAPRLRAMARRLEAAGALILAMPCNTAHVYLGDIRSAVCVPVIDMIAETAAEVRDGRVGLLATDGTIRSRLYHEACEKRGVDVVTPTEKDQRDVMALIASIKAGIDLQCAEVRVEGIVARLRNAGANGVIVGCTELSLLSGAKGGFRWHDALEVLVRATLREALS